MDHSAPPTLPDASTSQREAEPLDAQRTIEVVPPTHLPPVRPSLPQQWLHVPAVRPFLTSIITVLLCLVFAAMFFSPDLGDLFIEQGALRKLAVVEGEWWRMVTAAFLHGSPLHLATNVIFLLLIGTDTEAYYGRIRFLVLYALSLLGGSIASLFFLSFRVVAVGASGAIFGILGALLVFYAANYRIFGRFGTRRFRLLLIVVFLNYALSYFIDPALMAQTDNAAHMGGLLTGLAVGLILCPRYSVGSWRNPLVRELENVNRGRVPWIATAAIAMILGAAFVFSLLFFRI